MYLHRKPLHFTTLPRGASAPFWSPISRKLISGEAGPVLVDALLPSAKAQTLVGGSTGGKNLTT